MPCAGVTYTRTESVPDVYRAPFRQDLPATPAVAGVVEATPGSGS